jgi:lantibiotic modifying enzyme
VVLFLLELHKATGDRRWLADARAGADELLARLPKQTEPGLYSGISGIGTTLGEMWRGTGDSRYRDGVRAAVRMLAERARETGKGVQWDEVTDIISGSSGTGLFLLYAGSLLPDPSATALAARAGDRLLELGASDQGGLRWAMSPDFPRLMPNFSHGTAGVSYFLASLYATTKERRYLDGALAGAKYLQAIAKTDGNICLLPHHQPDGLDLYYLGWCHGPVGTARLWRRLAQVTRDQSWMTWVDRSARALLESGIPEKRTDGYWNNVSQCCGTAGIAEFFLDISRVTPDPAYLPFARRMTDDLLARATRDDAGMRWVQAENRTQPANLVAQTGYMQGASGIGMWLLRLDAAEHKRESFVRFPDSPW